MSLRGSIVTFAIAGTLASAAAATTPETSEACFADNSVTKVVPHRTAVPSGQGSYDRLVGARAYVPAKPGLTGEWLHAQLARRSGTPQEGTQCPLDVPGVAISVTSAGPGFWVSLAARDHDDAREVLRRAQTLAR